MSEANPTGPRHVSVMPAEVLRWLAPSPGQVIVDATAGAGGHALLVADAVGPSGRVVLLDRDETMLAHAKRKLGGRPANYLQASFDQLPEVLSRLGLESV